MPRVNLSEFIERKTADAALFIDLPDGTSIMMPPAELWVDAVYDALAADNMPEATRLILGDEQHDRFVAAGGTWRILNAIVAEQQGATMGESPASPNTSPSSAMPSKRTSSGSTGSTSPPRSARRR